MTRHTAGCSGIQRDTAVYSGIQRDTAGYYKKLLQSTGFTYAFQLAMRKKMSAPFSVRTGLISKSLSIVNSRSMLHEYFFILLVMLNDYSIRSTSRAEGCAFDLPEVSYRVNNFTISSVFIRFLRIYLRVHVYYVRCPAARGPILCPTAQPVCPTLLHPHIHRNATIT